MYIPKKDLYNKLNSLGYSVYQTKPAVFTKLPAITFRIEDNSVNIDLNNEIVNQDIIATIDIWTEDSPTASKITQEVEEILRSDLWRMNYCSDVPNNGNIFHIVTRFSKKI